MCTPAAADLFAAAVPFIIAGAGTAGPGCALPSETGLR